MGLPPQIWIEAWSELLQRLPLNIEKLIAPDPRLKRLSLEKQDAVDISYRASTLIFDLLIGHYRSIRMTEQFQSLWLRTISHLASGVQVIGSGNIQNEFIEMISSLFRILSSNSRSKCDLSLHETAPNNGTTPSSSSLCHQETPSSSSLPTHQDTILLQISWHAARANCPQLLQILKKSNPIILEIIQTTGNGHVPMKPAGVNSSSAGTGTPNGASEGSSTMNFTESYRNLYSRLFESKSQVV